MLKALTVLRTLFFVRQSQIKKGFFGALRIRKQQEAADSSTRVQAASDYHYSVRCAKGSHEGGFADRKTVSTYPVLFRRLYHLL